MKGKITAALFALLLGLAGMGVFLSSFGESMELSLLDGWFRLRGPVEPPGGIVLAALDEQSYADLKVPLNQSWPRSLHADLLESLREYGVKRVVFDILFIDPGADPEADKRFAESIAHVPTILGVESASHQVGGAGGRFEIEEILEPFDPLLKASAGTGLVGLPDDGGAIRRFLVDRSATTKDLPSLAEAAAGIDRSENTTLPSRRDLLRYYGPSRTIPTYSIYQLLDRKKRQPAQLLKDKVVVVGLVLRSETGPAQKDVFRSPFGGSAIFGAEVHATAAANLMEKRWIHRAGRFPEAAAVLLFGILTALFIVSVSPITGSIFTAAMIILWAGGSFISFHNDFFLPGVVPVLMMMPLVLLSSTLYYYLVARRSAQQMRSAFELYLSPQMAKELGSSRSIATLGGEKLWCTALFTDIQGFTGITEEMPAEKVSEMLNAYFTEVMEVVFQNQGTLIKFIGDAVFVLWGAPIKVANHAELAVKTALSIEREVTKFNQSGRFPALKTRIGIHTGPMVVGNLGSAKRFDYTAIGDSVNLASRVEGLNKYFGTSLLFTESTKKDAGNSVFSLRVGSVRVAGKREVINLYTSFDVPPIDAAISEWSESLSLFERREFAVSRDAFEKLSTRPEFAALAQFYLEQCDKWSKTPAPERWNGEILFDSK